MSLKSVFQNKIFVNILFFAVVFICAISFFGAFLLHKYDFYIPHFGLLNTPVKVNVEVDKENASKIRFFMDGYEIAPSRLWRQNSYAIYGLEHYPVSYLYFKPDNSSVLNSINNIVIHLGKNMYYYNNEDIKNFNLTPEGFYVLPFDIKYIKSGKYINDKGGLHKFFTYSMSIFYNSVFFIFPLIFLALAAAIYILNKEKFNFNFNIFKNNAIWLIIIAGALFRIQDNSHPFWGDELYSAIIAGGAGESWIKTLQDPGNPPLFFVLSKIWMIIFGYGESSARILPALFSILTIPAVYLFVKRNTNQNLAIFAAFLFAVNGYSVHSAQELRCYSLCILFAVVSAYFLFEIIKYKRNRDFVIYGILAVLMANTHYFQILILINNFIIAMFLLDNKSRLKFFGANLVAAVSFLPYLIFTGFSKGLMDMEFNKMPNYNFESMWMMFYCYFGNRIVAFLAIVLPVLIMIPKTRNYLIKEEQKETVFLFLYSFYMIISLYISACLFSNLIRPIVRSYYFVEILAFISIFTASVFFIPFKNKVSKAAFCLIFLLFSVFCITGRGVYINKDDVLVIRVEEMLKYAYYDSLPYVNNGKKIALAMFDFINYSSYYKDFVRGGEKLIPYRFGVDTPETFNNKLIESGADVIYSMLHKARAYEFIEQFEQNYDMSAIETDKGVIIVRMIKK